MQLPRVLGVWFPDLRGPRVGQRLQRRTVLRRLEARARGQYPVTIQAVDRNIGPVPIQDHHAAVDYLVLGTGRQNRVLRSTLGRGRAASAGQQLRRSGPESSGCA